MNQIQRSRINNLKHAGMLPRGPEHAFLKSMAEKLIKYDERKDIRPLSLKQHRYLAQLAYKFRRALPSESVPRGDPKFISDKAMIEEMRLSEKEVQAMYAD